MSPRVYVHKFDHANARARHAAGETIAALAREYGVSWQAVKLACDDHERALYSARSVAHMRSGFCRDCGKGGCRPASSVDGVRNHGRCRKCADKHAAKARSG